MNHVEAFNSIAKLYLASAEIDEINRYLIRMSIDDMNLTVEMDCAVELSTFSLVLKVLEGIETNGLHPAYGSLFSDYYDITLKRA